MKRSKSTVRIAAVIAIASAATLFLASKGKAQSPQNTFTPFTAHVVEELFGSAATEPPTSVQYITVERKSDGSEATSTTIDSPEPGTVGDILDVASLEHITLDSLTRSTMKFYLSAKELQDELDRRHCPDDFSAAEEHSSILGYDVVRYHARYGSQRRWETHDEWMAPELACFVLKGIFRTSRGAWNRTTVLSVTKGEPSSSMFTLPFSYVERSPVQLEKVYAAKYAGALWLPENSLQNLERNYETHQPNQ